MRFKGNEYTASPLTIRDYKELSRLLQYRKANEFKASFAGRKPEDWELAMFREIWSECATTLPTMEQIDLAIRTDAELIFEAAYFSFKHLHPEITRDFIQDALLENHLEAIQKETAEANTVVDESLSKKSE